MTQKIIKGKPRDLGGFIVKRVLPSEFQRMVGPFIFVDEMGPVHLKAEQSFDVRPHPHIGLATVTYMFEGTILHRDSLGYKQEILPGEVNLMVAGKGIVHSERTASDKLKLDRNLHGMQIWMALPDEYETIDPAFYHYEKNQIPNFEKDALKISVVIGKYKEHQSPVKTFVQTLYLEAFSKNASQTQLHFNEDEIAFYVVSGKLTVNSQSILPGEMIYFDSEQNYQIATEQNTRFIILGGEKFPKPRFIWWNFVASSQQKIDQAKQDWQNKKFPIIAGDAKEFIPLP